MNPMVPVLRESYKKEKETQFRDGRVNALGNEVQFSFELRVAPANLSAGYPATLVQFYINKIEMNSTRNGIIVTLQKSKALYSIDCYL